MQRKTGQNFLKNDKIAENIVKSLELKKGEKVLEIGPGKGILTAIIAKKNKITAIELDSSLKPHLDRINPENAEIIFKNALECDFSGYDKIVSNLPYDIVEPFFLK